MSLQSELEQSRRRGDLYGRLALFFGTVSALLWVLYVVVVLK